ncbi:hypothetical protein [Arcanobacterium phocae]|uniref:hypothetical protein n=2 Tax=Arcanobacterium phocae TaxID=131112 RepID=UPI001C0EA7B8|nr:hypothetical protein [Arcanobacterium phocae]
MVFLEVSIRSRANPALMKWMYLTDADKQGALNSYRSRKLYCIQRLQSLDDMFWLADYFGTRVNDAVDNII